MNDQNKIWRDEHLKEETFKRIHTTQPSHPLSGFIDLLIEKGFEPRKTRVLDLGCGKGRNSIWLASKGFIVTGIDFVEEAIEEARKRNVENYPNLKFEVVDLAERWSFENNIFQVILDCNTTICMQNPGRQSAVAEAYRVLEPGGLYLFYGVAKTDLVEKSPGPELNSAIFPKSGKFEKQYSKDELLKTYEKFNLISIKYLTGSDIIEGTEATYLMWVAIFQKPIA